MIFNVSSYSPFSKKIVLIKCQIQTTSIQSTSILTQKKLSNYYIQKYYFDSSYKIYCLKMFNLIKLSRNLL